MKDQEKLVWGATGILGVAFIWAANIAAPPRFYIVANANGGTYRVDRNSGSVAYCNPVECRLLSENNDPIGSSTGAGGAEGIQPADGPKNM